MSRAWHRSLVGGPLVVVVLCLAPALFSSCRTAGLKRVFMSLDQKGDRKRTTFFTDTEAIFCVGELVSARADITLTSTIKAKTIYDPASDTLVPARGIAWLGESAPGKTEGTFVVFELGKVEAGDGSSSERSPYPAGTFTCELAIDGEREDSVDFEVAFPACPVLAPITGQLCAGWVRPGSRCQGAESRPCLCDEGTGAWQCDR